MDQETCDRIPASLTLRQVEVNVTEPGVRFESLVIARTLIDTETYSVNDIAALYHHPVVFARVRFAPIHRWLIAHALVPATCRGSSVSDAMILKELN